MASYGIRIGAWDYLQWKHVDPIFRDNEVIALKLRVYPGDIKNITLSLLLRLIIH